MEIILILLIIFFVVSIPFNRVFKFLYLGIDSIKNKMYLNPNTLYISKAPIIYFLLLLIDFLKGFLPLLIITFFIYNPLLLFMVAFISVLLNIWNPWTNFRRQGKLSFILWGIFSYFSWPLFFVYIFSYLIFIFLTNSLYFAILFNTILMFIIMWLIDAGTIGLYFSLTIFFLLLFALREDIYKHFLDQRLTLKKLFNERL